MRRRPHSLVADSSAEADVTEGRAPIQNYKSKTAVVVGAGPAGLTSAAYLAKHGFTVQVFEGRKDIRSSAVLGARSINIVLTSKSLDVLREVGVDLPSPDDGQKSGLLAFRGYCLWQNDTEFMQFPDVTMNRGLGTRNGITQSILNVIERDYSSNVSIHFNHMCKSVSFEDQKVAFEDVSKKEVVVNYDLLIAANGAHSNIRRALVEYDKGFKVHTTVSERSYVGVDGLSVSHADHLCRESVSPGWLSITPFFGLREKEYVTTFIYAFTADGTVHGVFNARSKFFDVIKGSEEEWIDKVLPHEIPQEWKEGIVTQLKKVVASKTPAPVFLNKFNGPRTVVLGDAAHAVSAGLGFGCNMAVQDGKALSEALCAADGDLESIPRMFNDLRYNNIRCHQRMEAGFVSDVSQRPFWMTVWKFVCLFHVAVYALMAKLFSRPRPSFVHERVRDGQLSAVDAVKIIKRDCLVATMVIMMVLFFLVRYLIVPATKFALMKAL